MPATYSLVQAPSCHHRFRRSVCLFAEGQSWRGCLSRAQPCEGAACVRIGRSGRTGLRRTRNWRRCGDACGAPFGREPWVKRMAAEWVHDVARRELGVRTIIPPLIGRPTGKAPKGHWRKVMSERLHLTNYGQRWQGETVFSMIKRRQGSAVNATTYWSQCRGLMLKAITHNILILYAPAQSAKAA